MLVISAQCINKGEEGGRNFGGTRFIGVESVLLFKPLAVTCLTGAHLLLSRPSKGCK